MKISKKIINSQTSLETIPGVGPSLARDLLDLGIKRPSCLINKDPEKLYQKLIQIRGCHQDRCVLYVFRCAHYFATHKTHDPEKLKWWYWKDTNQTDKSKERTRI
jgi:hypothetical protein